tara:strand:+ start:285 stop:473 length:189 start_codon:yes stop_codon:yes gene_type:complete
MQKFLSFAVSIAVLVLFVDLILSRFFDIGEPASVSTFIIIVSSCAILYGFSKNSKKERRNDK